MAKTTLKRRSKKRPPGPYSQRLDGPVCIDGEVVKESLPLPWVHYPNLYGTFFAFSKRKRSPLHLCSCARSAVRNYLEIRSRSPVAQTALPLRMAPLDSSFFPDRLAAESLKVETPIAALRFKKGLCHRCNVVTPSLAFCRRVDGDVFARKHGWYISQAFLRFGMLGSNNSDVMLEEACPTDLLKLVRAASRHRNRAQDLRQKYGSTDGFDPKTGEVLLTRKPGSQKGWDEIRELDDAAARACHQVEEYVANIVREEFRFEKTTRA